METKKPARERDTDDRRREGTREQGRGLQRTGRQAVSGRELHDSVELFTNKAVAARNAVLHAPPDAPELRERAYRIKQETMANLDRYLEQMAEAVEARGGHVFFAEDGEDVVRYVGDLARRQWGASRHQVQEHGDRGDRAQPPPRRGLRGPRARDRRDRPGGVDRAAGRGHAVAHRRTDPPHEPPSASSRSSPDAAGEELPPDVEALGSFARERLREKFVSADIGITGANFGVAETGTIATVTNEGNARLVTSVPPVHVVVMGIEKVIPRFADLSVFIQLLSRSGTGQKITRLHQLRHRAARRRASSTGPRRCTWSCLTTAARSCSAPSSRRRSTASAAARA